VQHAPSVQLPGIVEDVVTWIFLKHSVVRTRIALPFIGRFRRGLQRFFRKGLDFQRAYIVLTFVARWRHNFREIAVKYCENPRNRRKSLCAPLSIDS